MNDRLFALSAQIEKMTPQQRQKFAMLHKDDPILLSLTKFVNDKEKALRQSMAIKPEAMNPPKVVDQEIASMTDPGVGSGGTGGVAALPAPNLEAMPEGGIAGDTVPQPPMSMKEGGIVPRYAGGGAPMSELDFYDAGGYSEAPAPDTRRLLERLTGTAKHPLAQIPPPVPRPAGLPSAVPDVNRQALQGTPPPPVIAPPQTMSTAGAATQAATAGLPAIARPQMGNPMTAPKDVDPAALLRQNMAGATEDPFRADRQALADRRVKEAEENRDRLIRLQEEMGEFGKDRESRLKKKEGKLDEREKSNAGMAIFEAGLAMMAGTSPFAAVNIGQGALVGTKRFKEGQKDIEDARDKLDDAFGRLEEVRRSEKFSNAKDRLNAEAEVGKQMTAGIESLLTGAEKALGHKREDARAILQAVIQDNNSRRQAFASIHNANTQAGASMYNADRHAQAYASRATSSGAGGPDGKTYQVAQVLSTAYDKIRDDTIKLYEMSPIGANPEALQRKVQEAWTNYLRNNPAMAQLAQQAQQSPGAPANDVSRLYDTSQIKVLGKQ